MKRYPHPQSFLTQGTVGEGEMSHHNVSLSAVALTWLRAQPSVSVPLASARTVEQVEEIVQVVELSREEVENLNGVSA